MAELSLQYDLSDRKLLWCKRILLLDDDYVEWSATRIKVYFLYLVNNNLVDHHRLSWLGHTLRCKQFHPIHPIHSFISFRRRIHFSLRRSDEAKMPLKVDFVLILYPSFVAVDLFTSPAPADTYRSSFHFHAKETSKQLVTTPNICRWLQSLWSLAQLSNESRNRVNVPHIRRSCELCWFNFCI